VSGRLALVLGGTRSGKSREAERLVARWAGGAPVTYLATATPDGDEVLAARVAAHRARRPVDWTTVDAGPDLAATLRSLAGPVLLDALGPWVAGSAFLASPTLDGLDAAVAALVGALVERSGDTVVVSEEVGLAVHPPTAVGRRFVDAVGTLNQAVAAVADDVRLVVAGRALVLPPADPDEAGGRR